MLAPSGDQFSISCGDVQATVTEVGATLRKLQHRGEDVLWGFEERDISTYGRGQVLFPWPNRLEDGRFSFRRAATAALDEPERHNAIHGLVRWMNFEPVFVGASEVTLAVTIPPQPGYPFRARLELTYEVDAFGLGVHATVHNLDEIEILFGLGFHPYFAPGRLGVDGARVEIPAATHVVTNERGLPVGTEPASAKPATAAVTSSSASLVGVELDDCFTNLTRDAAGIFRARFVTEEGGVVRELWADQLFSHVMCFTADSLASASRRRAVAIEPMTCAPNALREGVGAYSLSPGSRITCNWGIVVDASS